MPDSTYIISKQFSFCYGHRVWNQVLDQDLSENALPICRHIHGHEGLVDIFLEAQELENGMVTDFKHLNWLKTWIDTHIDHKFILDVNDPIFAQIAQGEIDGNVFKSLNGNTYPLVDVTVSDFVAGRVVVADEDCATATINSGLMIVDFVPTSENLARWLFNVVDARMSHVCQVKRVVWKETPKTQAVYQR